MFKKKTKKSHKSDEVFVEYSKEVDVRVSEEDEAVPEHYKALEVKDEVVVSKSQILQAKNMEEQDKRMEKRYEESNELENLSRESEVPDQEFDDEKNIEPIEEKEIEEIQVASFQQEDDEEEDIVEEVVPVMDVDKQTPEINDFSSNSPSFLKKEKEFSRTRVEEESSISENKDPDFALEDQLDEEENLQSDDDLEEMDVSLEENKEEEQARKKDLKSYFHKDGSVLKRGRKYKKKVNDQIDEKKQPVYSIKGHHFYSMEDFVSFLDTNYTNIEDLASAILQDEQFFRWLKDESIYFEDSIAKMKKFKQELKQ